MKTKSLLNFLILAILSTLFYTSCSKENSETENTNLKIEKSYYFNSAIATIDGNDIYFTNYNSTLELFQRTYSESISEEVEVYDISIEENEGVYLFTANTNIGSSGIILVQVDDELHESSKTYAGSSTATTCSGCKSTGIESTNECVATGNPSGGVYCTKCNEGDCIKTSTWTSKSILSDNSSVLAY